MIEALTAPLSPPSRLVGIWLAMHPGKHDFHAVRDALVLSAWDLEQAVRELGDPGRRLLVRGRDVEDLELRADVEHPFSQIQNMTKIHGEKNKPTKEKPHAAVS